MTIISQDTASSPTSPTNHLLWELLVCDKKGTSGLRKRHIVLFPTDICSQEREEMKHLGVEPTPFYHEDLKYTGCPIAVSSAISAPLSPCEWLLR